MQLLSLTHPTICHSARERVQADPCLLLLFPNLYARTVSSITLLIHLIHRLTSISVKNLSKFPSQLPYLYCSVTALPVFTYLFLIYLFRSMVEKYCSQLTHSIPFPGEYQLYSHSHVRHHWTSIHVEMKKSCSPYNSPLQSTFTIWSNAQHNSHRNQHRDQRSRLWAFQSQQTTSQQTSTRKKKKKTTVSHTKLGFISGAHNKMHLRLQADSPAVLSLFPHTKITARGINLEHQPDCQPPP